ncbi:flagellar basal body-associated FliL family protein [Bifidobacterium merycicum]|uniref:Uncharacterized protein n=1 Tax=Bifidobacterium merycicum TaxID=78345 RepID=A0A087BKX4_9BIFI|nr:hypothetical protein [Bifidobacterium merycicum]KFI71674.1 hypothetical protein BMERY_1196 [Bifidobacterium merycicum]MEE1294065.1 hypothetical protein [Bifidobacterium merycicum]SHE46898.1 hypothetical protein SAMN02745589_0775 [Bifidobacterium merycicum DSM 6492]
MADVEKNSKNTKNVNGGQDAQEKKANHHALVIIVAVALVICLCAGGWFMWNKQRFANAKAQCAETSDTLRVAMNEYNNLVNNDANDASDITADQVKDPKTVKALAKELEAQAPEYMACAAESMREYNEVTDKLNDQISWYKSHTASLEKAVKAVEASRK